MALSDLQSAYGPSNGSTNKGTGTILGHNTTPMADAQLGNPVTGAKTTILHDNLTDASHHSKYGPFNSQGTSGTGLSPDVFGNIPKEIDFKNYP
jgi:hypothetical protein